MTDRTARVVGEIDGKEAVGLLGINAATDGEAIAIKGETASEGGYGFYTPDNTHVGGRLEANELETQSIETARLGGTRYATQFESIQAALADLPEPVAEIDLLLACGVVALPGQSEGYREDLTVPQQRRGATLRGDGIGTIWLGTGEDHVIDIDSMHVTIRDLYLGYDGAAGEENDIIHIEPRGESQSQDHTISNIVFDANDARYAIYDDGIRNTFDHIYIRAAGEAGAYLSGAQGNIEITTDPHDPDQEWFETGIKFERGHRYHVEHHATLRSGTDQTAIAGSGNGNMIWVRADCSNDQHHTVVEWTGGNTNQFWVTAREAYRGVIASSSWNSAHIEQFNVTHPAEDARGVDIRGFNGWNLSGFIRLDAGGRCLNVDSSGRWNMWTGTLLNRGETNATAIRCAGDKNTFFGVFEGEIILDGDNNYIAGVLDGTLNDNGTGNDTSNLVIN